MNWEAIGALAEVGGVIAVVVSLVYVGLQVRQNTLQLQKENLRNTVRGTLDTNWYYHRDERAFDVVRRGVLDFDRLSAQEQAHFHSIVVDLSFYYELMFRLSGAGLLDRDALEVNERFLMGILVTPGGHQWWTKVRETQPMPQAAMQHLQQLLDTRRDEFRPITELQPWLGSEQKTS